MVWRDLRMFARYAVGLRQYLRMPLGPEECYGMIERQLKSRETYFLRILEKAVFENQRSPYRRLLERAGIELQDVVKLVREDGIEPTLERLYEEGVYISLDEFKGREPIRRAGLEFRVRPSDFDNPLLALHYMGKTGGSRGAGTRVAIDFDLLAHEAAYLLAFLAAFGLTARPWAMWWPVPPALTGIKNLLRGAKLGRLPAKWFAQNR